MSQPWKRTSGREPSPDPVVLVVDDDDDLRALIVEHLIQLGYPTGAFVSWSPTYTSPALTV